MARKVSVTNDMIVEGAFELMRSEGIEQVTARKLAAKVGCSTQPIFRMYESMDQLIREIYDKAVAYFEEYYDKSSKISNVPFVNLGMAYIQFANEEKQMFRMLFLSEYRANRGMYELLNGEKSNVATEISRAKSAGASDPEMLFMKMWIFIHGAACMCLTGDYDLSRKQTQMLLTESYNAYVG